MPHLSHTGARAPQDAVVTCRHTSTLQVGCPRFFILTTPNMQQRGCTVQAEWLRCGSGVATLWERGGYQAEIAIEVTLNPSHLFRGEMLR
jgi:hypothetical protein